MADPSVRLECRPAIHCPLNTLARQPSIVRGESTSYNSDARITGIPPRRCFPMTTTTGRHLIAGEWLAGSNGMFESRNPARNDEIVGQFPAGDARLADQ